MRISKIFEDPTGTFYSKLDGFVLQVNRFISTFFMHIFIELRGVKLGKGNVFYGRTFFRRCYKSTISIGNKCRFRSAFLSNNVGLNRPCFISTLRQNARITIGNNTGMSGTVIGCAESISIGNNVLLGGNTFITDFDWHSVKDRNTPAESKPVIIEDDVFIGLNAIILKGSILGKGCVIGANSVVAGTIPAGATAAGNPCRVIK